MHLEEKPLNIKLVKTEDVPDTSGTRFS